MTTLISISNIKQPINNIKVNNMKQRTLFSNKLLNRLIKNDISKLLNRVQITLRINPHNTFKGTPYDYIKKYNLIQPIVNYWKYI